MPGICLGFGLARLPWGLLWFAKASLFLFLGSHISSFVSVSSQVKPISVGYLLGRINEDYCPGCPISGVRLPHVSLDLRLAHPWCQRHTGQPHHLHQGRHEEKVGRFERQIRFVYNTTIYSCPELGWVKMVKIVWTDQTYCSDSSEVALEDNKISGKLCIIQIHIFCIHSAYIQGWDYPRGSCQDWRTWLAGETQSWRQSKFFWRCHIKGWVAGPYAPKILALPKLGWPPNPGTLANLANKSA